MNKDLRDKLQEYLDGQSSSEIKSQIESELAKNSELRQEYQILIDLKNELGNKKLSTFRVLVNKVGDNYKQDKKTPMTSVRSMPRIVLYIAASVLFIIGAFWLYNFSSQSNYEDAIAYYDFNEIYDKGSRSATESENSQISKTDLIVNFIAKKKYKDAIDLIHSAPSNDQLKLLHAHALISKGISKNNIYDYLSSIEILHPLLTSKTRTVREEAEWITLLSYSKIPRRRDDFDVLLQSIIDNRDHKFYGKARLLVDK